MTRVRILDSHTGGEPTRLILEGGPELPGGTLTEKAEAFRRSGDSFRGGVLLEPRGSEVLVGALLLPSSRPGTAGGVIFFNNVGVLGMCGHGAIGVITSLAWLGQIGVGDHILETPVGEVQATLHDDGRVTLRNVASRRTAADVVISIPERGMVRGDVAWGGNWFFLVKEPVTNLSPSGIASLTALAWEIRLAVNAAGYPEVDHVELFGPPEDARNHSRNFVLCPGKAWDRSPCGTGTSAKVACLAAEGVLAEGELWRQESIIGSVFECSWEASPDSDGGVIPSITGQAWVTAEASLLFDPADPFASGIVL